VFHKLRQLNIRIDWKRFKEVVSQDNILIGALMYMGVYSHIFRKKKKFLEYLERAGYVLRYGPIEISQDGKRFQRGIDGLISREMVELAKEWDAFDCGIVVSGDNVFLKVVQQLKTLQKEIVVWSFKSLLSRELRENANEVHYIDDILDEITAS